MKEKNLIKLSVVIPIFNEEETIPELVERLVKAAENISPNYELIFVNDGSKDGTLKQLKIFNKDNSNIKYISFSRNFGHQIAVSAGLDYAAGENVVIIDGDLQDPPELIPEMYKKSKQGYDVVYAKRASRKGESFFKKTTATLFYRLLSAITSVDIPLDTGDFRLMNRKVVKQLKQMTEKNKFLRGQIAWLGFKQTYVTFERDERKFGETGYPFRKMLKFALDGITSFSDVPLRLVRNVGFVVSIFAFAIILYAIFSHFVLKQTITGWSSLIISSMFIGGIQLFAIGIIGEYISRINTNLLNRPLYIIDESNVNEDLPKEE